AALLNWILHLDLNNKRHVHHMVSINPHTKTGRTCTFCFYCHICYTMYNLKVSKPRSRSKNCTCPGAPTHHLHTRVTMGKVAKLPERKIEIRCCSCNYYAILLCQALPISKYVMNAFIMPPKSKKWQSIL